jgi:hypothetical protein
MSLSSMQSPGNKEKSEIMGGTVKLVDLIGPAFDSLKVLIEPFEDRFHGFICPLPIHVEVYAVF